MPTLEALYRQDPESLPFRQPVDPLLLCIPVSIFKYTYAHLTWETTKSIGNAVAHHANDFRLLHRTTLTLWRIPLTYPPSSASWIRVSTRSHGSTWTMCGSCSTMHGCTIAKRRASTSTAPNWQKCLKSRSIPSCRAWATAAAGRWDDMGQDLNPQNCTFQYNFSFLLIFMFACMWVL